MPAQTAAAPAGRESFLGRWVANWSLNVKILSVVAVLSLVGAGIGTFAITRMSALSEATNSLYTGSVVPAQQIEQLAIDIGVMRAAVLNHAVADNAVDKSEQEATIRASDASFDEHLAAYRANAADPGLLDLLVTAWQQYRTVRDQEMLPASLRDDRAEVAQIREGPLGSAAAGAMTALDNVSDAEDAAAHAQADRARHDFESARTVTIAVLVAGLALATLFGLLIARSIVRRVRAVSGVVDALATGDLTRSAGVTSTDEIGLMARQLDRATETLRDTVTRIGASSQTLAGSAQEMSTVSTTIAGNAEQTSSRADLVSAAAEEVSANVDTVAAASEEMTASIREIASSAADAAGIARGAVDVAQSANRTVAKLGVSSAEVGNIVKVITSIAEQTNLLALNATIEAARAGDAGKGFAVVASEVKDLAQETAKATEEISDRIQAIQTDTSAAVDAIGQIAEVIERINTYSDTIASAVEEQTATTSEIGRNVAEAAAGSTNIAETITGVAEAAQHTHTGVAESQRTTEELSRLASELQTLVGRFRV
jgi:methyl-accepting chemotaxis protein